MILQNWITYYDYSLVLFTRKLIFQKLRIHNEISRHQTIENVYRIFNVIVFPTFQPTSIKYIKYVHCRISHLFDGSLKTRTQSHGILRHRPFVERLPLNFKTYRTHVIHMTDIASGILNIPFFLSRLNTTNSLIIKIFLICYSVFSPRPVIYIQ